MNKHIPWKKILLILLLTECALQLFSFSRYVYYLYDARVKGKNWYVEEKENAWITAQNGKIDSKYHPFLGWTYTPISEPETHIDDKIIRRTIGNPDPATPDIPSYFFFGGSTMWGAFAKDNETIPSYIANKINTGKPSAYLTNYGHIAYNSNQELVLLMLLLKDGKIPDRVVFYDGCNDFNTSPRLVYSQELVEEYLGGMDTILFPIISLENKSLLSIQHVKNTILFLKKHIKIIHYPWSMMSPKVRKVLGIPKQELVFPPAMETARITAENYRKNAEVIAALSKAYGFDYLLLWQPLIYNKPLTEKENKYKRMNPERIAPYKETTRLINEMRIPNFVDLTQIFSASAGASFFIDDCHVTNEANRIIGEKITDLMTERF